LVVLLNLVIVSPLTLNITELRIDYTYLICQRQNKKMLTQKQVNVKRKIFPNFLRIKSSRLQRLIVFHFWGGKKGIDSKREDSSK